MLLIRPARSFIAALKSSRARALSRAHSKSAADACKRMRFSGSLRLDISSTISSSSDSAFASSSLCAGCASALGVGASAGCCAKTAGAPRSLFLENGVRGDLISRLRSLFVARPHRGRSVRFCERQVVVDVCAVLYLAIFQLAHLPVRRRWVVARPPRRDPHFIRYVPARLLLSHSLSFLSLNRCWKKQLSAGQR